MSCCLYLLFFFFFNDTATTEIYTLPLHAALPISSRPCSPRRSSRWAGSWPAGTGSGRPWTCPCCAAARRWGHVQRSEEHTSELQSRQYLVCRLLLEKKKKTTQRII